MGQTVIDVLTLVISVAALVMAILAIFAENRQSLFDQRVRVYLLFKDLLETYKHYYELAMHQYRVGEPVSLDDRFQWLTNTPILKDIQGANNRDDLSVGCKEVSEACTQLLNDAEEVGLLWKRRKRFWFSKEIRNFMRTYALFLTAIMEYKKIESDYLSMTEDIQGDNIKLSAEQLENIIQIRIDMSKAEQKASDLDDQLLFMYENRIKKAPPKKNIQTEYEEALISMKDSTRL